jgi:hypothetical protein
VLRMSENHSKLDAHTRDRIGQLLREMYTEPQEPSSALFALIEKLRAEAPPRADEKDPEKELNQTAPE